MLNPSEFVDLWKSKRPYATDNFQNGLYRMDRELAIEKRYIETSPKTLRNIVTIDLDMNDAEWHFKGLMYDEPVMPEYSFFTINPLKGTAHANYFIEGSVQSKKALEYLKDITDRLTLLAGGDPAYGGRIMRNPLHEDQRTIWGTDHLYTLDELNEYAIKAKTHDVPINTETEAGEGRNAALFEALRKWSYRERLKYDNFNDFRVAMGERANELNFSFETPLAPSEVKTICNSTIKWVWKRFNKETFLKIQKARSHKREVVKNAPAKDKAILDMLEMGFSVTEVSENLGVSYDAAKTAIYTARKREAQRNSTAS